MTLEKIIAKLHELGNKDSVLQKNKKYRITAANTLGVYQKDLNTLARGIGRNNALALQLFDSGIYEARILCSKIFNPADITEDLMEKWVKTFENWEICDSFCLGFFACSKFAVPKAKEWSSRSPEFEKRAAFAIMAGYCMADKIAGNATFEQFLSIIKREAHDERHYVKKAVNWALRNIGKRNIDLNTAALQTANEILKLETKSAQWIARDALRELESKNANILDYPRKIYRKT